MSLGKSEKLDLVLKDFESEIGYAFKNCVVTNEQGLVVAGRARDLVQRDRLAAMISLLSDTSRRVNENLGYDHPRISTIKGSGVSITVHEFKVRNRWFRIGAEIRNGRFLFFKRIDDKKVWKTLEKAADSIRAVLESR